MATSLGKPTSSLPQLHAGKSLPKSISSNQTHDGGFTEVIERILSTQQHRADSVDDDMEGLLGRTSSSGFDESLGPLIPSELLDLSMLCAKQSSLPSELPSSHRNTSSKAPSSSNNGFGSVDVETLSCLVVLLEKHVSLASRIDIIQEAYNASRVGSSNSSPNGKVTPIDQVS
jgi:hypothetical protein